MTTTHSNFKSLDETVKSINDVKKFLDDAFYFQEVQVYPITKLGNDNFLDERKFEILLDKIDRLYVLIHETNYDIDKDEISTVYHMICRMEYDKNNFIFVEFVAYHSSDIGLSFLGKSITGNIFIFQNPSILSVNPQITKQDMIRIYNSLIKDGYELDYWYNVPSLKYFCLWHIYENNEKFKDYEKILPQTLVNSLTTFINNKKSYYDYLPFSVLSFS